ncbi:pancreatic triacylglycerol lipase-like [Hylaeus volcanicus]|uniref:pancreatic triacylglycerol lipase-like n=1 Tax=Hylaeus volcanicus TaxID=313075 RepID=UPI0023B83159|nr:pancreatic triacylglycerol lipase-like [Hylaeus volcanicus]
MYQFHKLLRNTSKSTNTTEISRKHRTCVASQEGGQGSSLIKDLKDDVDIAMHTVAAVTNITLGLKIWDDNENLITMDLELNDPESVERTKEDLENRVFFYLYTRENPKDFEQLKVDDIDMLKRSKFDASKPTKFITHGWINSYMSKACVAIRDAFLQHGDYNVIVVDWSRISSKPYLWAARRVVMIGQLVARMIDFLVSQGLEPSKVTAVGHSLGAHVVGLSGYYSKNKIEYIVGLDPALPLFLLSGAGARITSDDARYVEIIHTNGGELGFVAAIGDSDFYPNGGSIQTGCPLDVVGACSHLHAVEYFAESINSKTGFWAVSCTNFKDFVLGKCNSQPKALMGGVEPKFDVMGIYYLRTHKTGPFAMGL